MEQFTIEEINLICFFDTSNRGAVIQDLILMMNHSDDVELIEIAQNAIKKVKKMSDEDFVALILCPIYDDEENMEVDE